MIFDRERFWSRVDKTGSCWLWTGSKFANGYGRFHQGNTSVLAHRLSYRINNGEIPEGLFICHRCDTPLCVNPAHLFVGTAKDNKHDCMSKDRHSKGERHPLSKLTTEQAAEIRALYAQGRVRRGRGAFGDYRQVDLAAMFNVKRATIANVVDNRNWVPVPMGAGGGVM